MPTASMKRQPFRDARGQGVIVFDPARVRQAVPGLFEATTYGADAQPVLEGMIISLAVAVMIMPMSPMEISFSVEMAMTLL